MVELHEEIQPVKSIYHVPAPRLATDLATRTITSVWNLRDRSSGSVRRASQPP